MKNLRAASRSVLQQVETLTGKPVQFMRDDKLSIMATLQMARNGAEFHVLRYRPTDEPLDYLIAHQAGFVLRLFQNPPEARYDFAPAPQAGSHVEALLKAAPHLQAEDLRVLPDFAKFVAQWTLMNLRSMPVGMRVDAWIAETMPELRELQTASLARQQRENAALLAYRLGRLTIPPTLMGTLAAFALFTDRLSGSGTFAVPYGATGSLERGQRLLDLLAAVPDAPTSDCTLIDQWAAGEGLSGWYSWIPFVP